MLSLNNLTREQLVFLLEKVQKEFPETEICIRNGIAELEKTRKDFLQAFTEYMLRNFGKPDTEPDTEEVQP